MIDSHSHIYCDAFDADRDEVVARAQAAGVRHIVLPNEGLSSVDRLQALHDRYPDYVSMAMGLHPEEVREDYADALSQLRLLFDRHRYVGVGEIGTDLYWDKTYRKQQMLALEEQLRWCVALDLPFIMHVRDSLDETLEVMEGIHEPLRGVFHSFTGSVADVERVRSHGDYYFGVNGIVTFKKSAVADILPAVGLDRLLLETDAPYMAPVPCRGKRNESAFIPYICDFVARSLGVCADEVSVRTDENANRLFRLF